MKMLTSPRCSRSKRPGPWRAACPRCRPGCQRCPARSRGVDYSRTCAPRALGGPAAVSVPALEVEVRLWKCRPHVARDMRCDTPGSGRSWWDVCWVDAVVAAVAWSVRIAQAEIRCGSAASERFALPASLPGRQRGNASSPRGGPCFGVWSRLILQWQHLVLVESPSRWKSSVTARLYRCGGPVASLGGQ